MTKEKLIKHSKLKLKDLEIYITPNQKIYYKFSKFFGFAENFYNSIFPEDRYIFKFTTRNDKNSFDLLLSNESNELKLYGKNINTIELTPNELHNLDKIKFLRLNNKELIIATDEKILHYQREGTEYRYRLDKNSSKLLTENLFLKIKKEKLKDLLLIGEDIYVLTKKNNLYRTSLFSPKLVDLINKNVEWISLQKNPDSFDSDHPRIIFKSKRNKNNITTISFIGTKTSHPNNHYLIADNVYYNFEEGKFIFRKNVTSKEIFYVFDKKSLPLMMNFVEYEDPNLLKRILCEE